MAHAAPARPVVGPGSLHWAGPVLIGLCYGLWAANIQRRGDAVTAGNVVLGVVTGVLVAAVYFTLRRVVAERLPRGLRAAAWGAFAGLAVGFLHSLANTTVLWSSVLGLIVAASTAVLLFYRYCTTED